MVAQKVEIAQVKMHTLAAAVARGQSAFDALGTAISAVFVGLPKAAMEAERLGNAFRVLTGSASAAAAEQKFVREEVQRLGISLAEAQQAWLKPGAAVRGTALEGESVRKVFTAVAGAASTMGLSAAETSGVLLAIGRMMSKGTVQADQLRGQLGDRLCGALGIDGRTIGLNAGRLFMNWRIACRLTASNLLLAIAGRLRCELG